MLTETLLHTLQYGFTLLPDEQREAADLWLVNTCTVKSPSQSAMDNVISAGRQLGKHLIVAGCVPQGEPMITSDLHCTRHVSHGNTGLIRDCKGYLLQVTIMPRRWKASVSSVRRLHVVNDPFQVSAAEVGRCRISKRCRCLSSGVSQIDRIVEAVEETLKGNTIHMLAKKSLPRLDLPKVHHLLKLGHSVTHCCKG